ncbi:spore coat protein U domain-containing protein [Persephonella sp.]|uniref:spore coat protein U domain-containing protein n=1 Tax=Persephonella sp. TaxID=2060922 RepID=UPI0025F7961D|nr:spore coat protein U domain-containing protein [Persephonella sp.]
MKKLLAAAVIAAAPFAAMAGTVSDDFTITANVAEKCVILSGPADITVNYDPFDTNPVTASTSVDYDCVKQTTYDITVQGQNGVLTGATYGESLTYNLTTNPASLTGLTDTNGIVAGTPETLTIDVEIPPGQNVSVDTYTETVDVTITY